MAKNDSLDNTFMALSDPTRRAILERLYKGEARVTDLAKPFPISLNSVSKHIMILERAGLVSRRKSGRDHFLTFNPEAVEDCVKWINAQRPKWRKGAAEKASASEQDNDDKKKPAWKFWG